MCPAYPTLGPLKGPGSTLFTKGLCSVRVTRTPPPKEYRNGKYLSQYPKIIFIAICSVPQSQGFTTEIESVG